MFGFEIIHIPNILSIDTQKIEEILKSIHTHVAIPQKGILNIAFLDDTSIKDLNKKYRNIDRSTDVLSFHYFEAFDEIDEGEIAGECIFSLEKIIGQAKQCNHSNEDEFYILFIHSVLHILGFDHEDDADFEEMWKYEKILRKEFGLSVSR